MYQFVRIHSHGITDIATIIWIREISHFCILNVPEIQLSYLIYPSTLVVVIGLRYCLLHMQEVQSILSSDFMLLISDDEVDLPYYFYPPYYIFLSFFQFSTTNSA
jgi:hypothetical protein